MSVNRRLRRPLNTGLPGLLLLAVLSCAGPPSYPEAPMTDGAVSLDLQTIRPGIPRYYAHRAGGQSIRFFVVRTGQGATAYLDACAKCYPRNKGFRADDDSVVCLACNERYPLQEIEKGFGSCYPIRIEGEVSGGRYLISAAKLEKLGAKYFP